MRGSIFNFINNQKSGYYIVLGYLGISIIFSFCYYIILPLFEGVPALRHNIFSENASYVGGYFDCFYFSITSQTTVGYGDIIPATLGGKVISMAQVVFGYFYLALAVSFFTVRAIVKSDKFEKFLRSYGDQMNVH